ncbi:glutamate receptor-interacting protein 2-like isoform X2 [Limulus polyphemus]|uniref:Glutamate receptor-interacting protein 2-like isoform X2 n=1 Tax=Limulus polyphemus TaxID=6850 RepID=A0ABM1SB64_LIMPO|nr:glutamate receptor-interacting protein 2-like isoform X2 [Limulus polyphemus]
MVWRFLKRCVKPSKLQQCTQCHNWTRKEGEDGTNLRHQVVMDDMSTKLDRRLSFISGEKRGTSKVELVKQEGTNLGLIITGGIDEDSRPKIANFRPGSIAHRSDALAVGDYLISVNGIRTNNLCHDEIVNLLMNAGDTVTLEVEYENPIATEEAMCVLPKVIQITLEKENGSFGFTLRGGACSDRLKSRPLKITHVRPGGPTDREGTIKAGDRLLAAENINLGNATLQEALAALKKLDGKVLFTVEYDVSVMDAVCNASGPLLVEIDKSPGTELGITLTQMYRPESLIVIESIKQASIAERCGALHAGDHILAIDGTRIDQMTVAEASQLLKASLKEVIKLEIFPISQILSHKVPEHNPLKGPVSVGQFWSKLNYNRLSSTGSRSPISSRKPLLPLLQPSLQGRLGRQLSQGRYLQQSVPSSNACASSSLTRWAPPTGRLSHTETTAVTIQADLRGFGFALQGVSYTREVSSSPIITGMDPGGPAERTGVLHVGDRVLAVNGLSTQGRTVEEVTKLLQRSRPRITLDIEFDVAEAVVPSSGTFTVKLAKSGGGLGIMITAPKNRQQGEPLIISDIKKGSVAHRTGTLQPGDKLLAIDSVRMDNCTLDDASEIMKACDQVVKLRIRKDETFSEEPDASGSVVYTVELVRHGGPLGITISGTEEPFEPIVISGLTSDGLAEKTGAIHVGDRLLAINGQSLRGKPLSEAILMLQNSGDVVTLKISKTPSQNREEESKIEREEQTQERDAYINIVSKTLPSVDSAVESWGSSGLEISINRAGYNYENQECYSTVTESSIKQSSDYDPEHCGTGDKLKQREWEDEGWELQAYNNHNCRNCGSSHSGGKRTDWSETIEDLNPSSQSELLGRDQSVVGSDPGHLASQQSQFCGKLQSSCENMFLSGSQTVSVENICVSVSQPELVIPGQSEDDVQRCSTLPHIASRRIREKGQNCVDDNVVSYQSSLVLPVPIEIHKVTLFKDQVYEDFGFSVSDGRYERGVYVNRIRPAGPASISGILKPLDRILQVNNTDTSDFDCCLAVPLIAAAGDRIEIVLSRRAYESQMSLTGSTHGKEGTLHPWMDEGDREDCSSPQLPPEGSVLLTKAL